MLLLCELLELFGVLATAAPATPAAPIAAPVAAGRLKPLLLCEGAGGVAVVDGAIAGLGLLKVEEFDVLGVLGAGELGRLNPELLDGLGELGRLNPLLELELLELLELLRLELELLEL